jgi:hypothetical protein
VASKPMFDFRLEGRAISRFSPARTPPPSSNGFGKRGGAGKLTIDLPGNGGISTIQFEEVRKLTPSD